MSISMAVTIEFIYPCACTVVKVVFRATQIQIHFILCPKRALGLQQESLVTYCNHKLYKRNGRNICDFNHWFVDCCPEANSFGSGQRHFENFRCKPENKTQILLMWA